MCRSKADGGRRCTPHLKAQTEEFRKSLIEEGVSPLPIPENEFDGLTTAKDFRNYEKWQQGQWRVGSNSGHAHRGSRGGSSRLTKAERLSLLQAMTLHNEKLLKARELASQAAEEERKAKAEADARRIWGVKFDSKTFKGVLGAGFTENEWVQIQLEASAQGFESASDYLRDVARRSLTEENLEGRRAVNGRIVHDDRVDGVRRGNTVVGRQPAQERDAETEEEVAIANARGKVTDLRETRKFRATEAEAAVLFAKAAVFGNTPSDQLRYEALGFDPRKGENHRGRVDRGWRVSTQTIRLRQFEQVEEGIKNPRDVFLRYQRAVNAKLDSWGMNPDGTWKVKPQTEEFSAPVVEVKPVDAAA